MRSLNRSGLVLNGSCWVLVTARWYWYWLLRWYWLLVLVLVALDASTQIQH